MHQANRVASNLIEIRYILCLADAFVVFITKKIIYDVSPSNGERANVLHMGDVRCRIPFEPNHRLILPSVLRNDIINIIYLIVGQSNTKRMNETQRSLHIVTNFIWFWKKKEKRKTIYLNDASNRIIVILVNFSFPICPGPGLGAAIFARISQPIFDYLRHCVEVGSYLSILHKCMLFVLCACRKQRLNWNPIIILDIGAKRHSYHRFVLLRMHAFDVWGSGKTLPWSWEKIDWQDNQTNKQLTNNNNDCAVLCVCIPAYRLENRNFSEFIRSAFQSIGGEIT